MSNIEKHRAFIESLEGEKGLPEEMHAWRFDEPLQPFDITMFMYRDGEGISKSAVAYLVERIRRAESRQIPDLKEKVKELVRDAMSAERGKWIAGCVEQDAKDDQCLEFRAICAEVKK